MFAQFFNKLLPDVVNKSNCKKQSSDKKPTPFSTINHSGEPPIQSQQLSLSKGRVQKNAPNMKANRVTAHRPHAPVTGPFGLGTLNFFATLASIKIQNK